MVFIPTDFVDGAPPAIDAAELNKLGVGVAAATSTAESALSLAAAVVGAEAGAVAAAAQAAAARDEAVAAVAETTGFTPADIGLKACSYDPALAASQDFPLWAEGTLFLRRLRSGAAITATSIVTLVTGAGTSLTPGRCLAGVYSPDGVLLGSTGDQSTAWASTGRKNMALTASVTIPARSYFWIALCWSGTGVAPAFLARPSDRLNASATRDGIAGSGITTQLPANLPTVTSSTVSYWLALS